MVPWPKIWGGGREASSANKVRNWISRLASSRSCLKATCTNVLTPIRMVIVHHSGSPLRVCRRLSSTLNSLPLPLRCPPWFPIFYGQFIAKSARLWSHRSTGSTNGQVPHRKTVTLPNDCVPSFGSGTKPPLHRSKRLAVCWPKTISVVGATGSLLGGVWPLCIG